MQKNRNRRQIALKRAISTAQNPIIPAPFFDDSWRGPDTQRGRYVPCLEKDCGGRKGLGMEPAKFEVLADWCSMGHLPSMRRMRQHFESRISPEARRRMEDYLNDEAKLCSTGTIGWRPGQTTASTSGPPPSGFAAWRSSETRRRGRRWRRNPGSGRWLL